MVCVLLLSYYYCRAFTCSNGKGSWRFRVSRRQTSTSPITLDHARLLVNVHGINNHCEWTRQCQTGKRDKNKNNVLMPALIIEININKRQARKLIWPRKPCYSSQILQ